MNLNGTYRGFSPTDESGVGLGELELTIDDRLLTFRFATGLGVKSSRLPRSEFRRLSPQEMAVHFKPDTNTEGITGYTIGEGPILLFLTGPEFPPEEPHVLVLKFVSEDIDNIFGPTYLFTPEQVQAGCFDRAVEEIETDQGDPGVVPRLANNGQRG